MSELNEWLAIVALFVVLPVLTWPETLRALARLAARVNDWAAAHTAPTQERDDDEEELWLTYRTRKLCADLARVEHLVATDSAMSATRQLGNRLAYAQLIDNLNHTPGVCEPHSLAHYGATTVEPGLIRLSGARHTQQPATVEVLEIGRRTRRR